MNKQFEIQRGLCDLDKTSPEKAINKQTTNLYILQVKNANKNSVCVRKCGIEVGENYNLPKSENAKQPQCPVEKEKAIKEPLEHFGML